MLAYWLTFLGVLLLGVGVVLNVNSIVLVGSMSSIMLCWSIIAEDWRNVR